MRLSLRWEELHRVVRCLGIHAGVQESRSSGSAETQAATQAQEETNFSRLLWLEIVQGGYDDTVIDKVSLTQVIGMHLPRSPCRTKDQPWRVWR